MITEWMTKYEAVWLFVVLVCGLVIELHSNYMLRKEYEYDLNKDLARKRTRTTKKTTTDKTGVITTEETNEVVEPVEEKK